MFLFSELEGKSFVVRKRIPASGVSASWGTVKVLEVSRRSVMLDIERNIIVFSIGEWLDFDLYRKHKGKQVKLHVRMQLKKTWNDKKRPGSMWAKFCFDVPDDIGVERHNFVGPVRYGKHDYGTK